MLKRFGCFVPIEMVRIKYLNNQVEQDHRFIKRRVRPRLCFKSFTAAASTIAGIELVNMIRKGQFTPELRPFSNSVSSPPETEEGADPRVMPYGLRQSR